MDRFENRTYYEILKVSPTASREEIRSAYRKLAKLAHPDRHGGSKRLMGELNEAYSTLIDANRRKEYDAKLVRLARKSQEVIAEAKRRQERSAEFERNFGEAFTGDTAPPEDATGSSRPSSPHAPTPRPTQSPRNPRPSSPKAPGSPGRSAPASPSSSPPKPPPARPSYPPPGNPVAPGWLFGFRQLSLGCLTGVIWFALFLFYAFLVVSGAASDNFNPLVFVPVALLIAWIVKR